MTPHDQTHDPADRRDVSSTSMDDVTDEHPPSTSTDDARREPLARTAPPDDDPHERLAHLRGALRLTRAGVELATDLAEDIHTAITAPLALVDRIPAVGTLRRVHDRVRGGIYTGIRAINRLVFDT